jgi:hypothetical protein
LFFIEEVDRMLVYLIKRVAICLPIWEQQVPKGEMENCSRKFVCFTFLGFEEKESLIEQS